MAGLAGMELFVHRQNLDRFRKQLADANDAAQRLQILKLLAEEEAKEPTQHKAIMRGPTSEL